MEQSHVWWAPQILPSTFLLQLGLPGSPCFSLQSFTSPCTKQLQKKTSVLALQGYKHCEHNKIPLKTKQTKSNLAAVASVLPQWPGEILGIWIGWQHREMSAPRAACSLRLLTCRDPALMASCPAKYFSWWGFTGAKADWDLVWAQLKTLGLYVLQ